MLKYARDSMGTSILGLPADHPNIRTNHVSHIRMIDVKQIRLTLGFILSMRTRHSLVEISVMRGTHSILPVVSRINPILIQK